MPAYYILLWFDSVEIFSTQCKLEEFMESVLCS